MPDDNSLDTILKRAGGKITTPKPDAEPEPHGEWDALSLADMNGGQVARPTNKEAKRIHIILTDGKVKTLQYSHLDAMSEFDGGSFTVTFIGAKHWELKVEGRNLWRVYDYLTLGRWPYIRVATRDFGDGNEGKSEVVTAVKITDVTPKFEE